jgi:Tfp pilus assembly protein PilF
MVPAKIQRTRLLYFRMGEAYRGKGDVDFSITLLQQAQKLQPDNAAVSNLLAFVLQSAGQTKAAQTEYRKILETDPQNALIMNNLAFCLPMKARIWILALVYAHHARQLVPNEPVIADTLGWVYLKNEQHRRGA